MSSTTNLDTTAPADSPELIASVVAAAAAGDREAWETLVGRYSGLVWSIARSYRLNAADAAEVSQSVWLSLVSHMGQIREPKSIGAWLGSVTRNECLRTIRKGGREVPVFGMDEHEKPVDADTIEHDVLAEERRVALYQAMNRLPPKWQALMRVLMTDPAPSYAEVAAALDMPIGSIGPIRQRCLARMRNSPEIMALAGSDGR